MNYSAEPARSSSSTATSSSSRTPSAGPERSAVDGGGGLVLLTPGLDAWPAIRDRFDDSLAVPPYGIEDVTGRFRERFVGTLRSHPGIAVVSLGTGPDGNDAIERDGLVGSRGDAAAEPTVQATAEKPTTPPNAPPNDVPGGGLRGVSHGRPGASGEGIRVAGDAGTRGRRRGGPRAREVERGGDRGGGARARALGADVLVTAPAFRNAAEVFARASELIGRRERRRGRRRRRRKRAEQRGRHPPHRRAGGGRVRFLAPAEAADLPDDPDAVIVDEAGAPRFGC